LSLPVEIAKKVKLLEISTRKLVNNIFAGEYHTVFKGQGMTFADFREYVAGDDVRHISWTLTARAGRPYIKKFDEERELSLMLVVDVSGSSDFGSQGNFKGEVMAHIAALMAFSAARNKDQVGLLLFSDQVEHFVPPKKGQGHIRRILRDLYFHKPKSQKTRMDSSLRFLQGLLKKRSLIFIISDFYDSNFDVSLSLLGKKHEVIAVVVQDEKEKHIPDMGLVDLFDPETEETVTVDSSSKVFRDMWLAEIKKQEIERDRMLRLAGVDRIDIFSNGDYVDPLIKYFRSRHRR
jgi:uncharacterized protein (DUF58 family)